MKTMRDMPHIVIIGGGFGGLAVARSLRKAAVKITIIDKHNFHLFQPLLYQVATGGLSPADIASPIRVILKEQKNATVLLGTVVDIEAQNQKVILKDQVLAYDILVVATGMRHFYYGHDDWKPHAPGLKNIQEATALRSRILGTFEHAETETTATGQRADPHFVIIGGGSTGVELAGALSELIYETLKNDFRHFDPLRAHITLVESQAEILNGYHKNIVKKAKRELEKKGVHIKTKALVTNVDDQGVTIRRENSEETIKSNLVLWAAGVAASPLGKILKEQSEASLDKQGRVVVNEYCQVTTDDSIYVIGDLAHFEDKNGTPLPGVAAVARQQGRFVADHIKRLQKNKPVKPFHYVDKGSLAVIGRGFAVAEIAGLRFSGLLAWLIWLFVHIMYLVGFETRLLVFIQWAINYITRNRSALLITVNPEADSSPD